MQQDGQGWLSSLNVPAAWSYSKGAGVTIAVLSTGVDATDPDLTGAVVSGPDFSQSGRVPGGPYWGAEGTAVASLIAGRDGIAPSAHLLSLRVTLEYNDPLNGDTTVAQRLPGAIASGIRYAVAHGATVIDLPLDPGSLGLNGAGLRIGDPSAAGGSPAERSAVAFALSRGVVLVAPAGDSSGSSKNYPAAYPGVIAVGATGATGTALAPFSDPVSYVALTAPGTGLTVAAPPSGFTTLSTTDNAAALVAGIAALIRSGFPGLSVAQVTAVLERSTGSAAKGSAGTGFGLVNAGRALRAAAAIAMPPRAAATPPASGHRARARARMTSVSPANSAAATMAGTAVRYTVFGAGSLVVVFGLILLVGRARRRPVQRHGTAIPNARHAGARGRRPGGEGSPLGPASGAAHNPGRPGRLAAARPGSSRGAGSLGLNATTRGQQPALLPVPKSGPGRRMTIGRGARQSQPPWPPAPPPAEPPRSPAALSSPAALPPPAPLSASAAFPLPAPTPGQLTGPDPFSQAGPFTGPPGTRAGQTGNALPPASPPVRAVPDVPAGLSEPHWSVADRFAAAPVPHDLPDWGTLNPGAAAEAFPAVSSPDDDPFGPGPA